MRNDISAGCVVVTEFVTSNSSIFSGYIDYMDRENAVRNEHISDFSVYTDYMGNPEKTTDLFTANSNHLSAKEKQGYKHLYEKAQDNGSPMWQTVISFDNRWLEEHGLFDSESGIVAKNSLMNYTREAVGEMLKSEGLENAIWTAAFHYNTDNLHVHIATVEPTPTRKKVQVKTIRFPADWVKDNEIIRFDSITTNKKVAAHKEKNYGYRNIYNRITEILSEQGYNTRLLGDYITINSNGSIDLSFTGQEEQIPYMTKLVDEHWEYKGKFKKSSIDKCRSVMVNHILESSKDNKKILTAMRENISVSMKGNILFEDREIISLFLSVYNRLPEQRNDWHYRINKIASLRSDIDKITEIYLSKYKLEEFNKFKEIAEAQHKIYNTAYGGDKNHYKQNQIKQLYERCGNAILNQMKQMSLRDIKELESSSYIAAEVEEAAATGESIDFDGNISYKSNSENQSTNKYWTKAFKSARVNLAEALNLEEGEERTAALKQILSIFKNEVSNGNDVAAYELGRCYKLGTFGEINLELSQQYYETAFKGFTAELNSDRWLNDMIALKNLGSIRNSYTREEYEKKFNQITANIEWDNWLNDYLHYKIGRMLINGEGTDKDIQEGILHLEESSSPFAYYALGNIYYRSNEVPTDYTKAYEYYSLAGFPEAGQKSMPFAVYNMAEMIEKGLITDNRFDKDYLYKKALSEFKESDEQEPNDLVEYKIASMLLEGKGCEANKEEAEYYFTQSAIYGNTYAQTKLANLFIKSGNPNLAGKAVFLLELASESGNDTAQYQLGKICIDKGSKYFDMSKGLDLLEKSAEQNNQFAQYALGIIYLNGEGENIEPDTVKAIEYLELSSEQGNEFAQYQLGNLYSSEKYGVKNIYKALTNYLKAAEQGNQFAQYRLGILYYKGDDIEQDAELAIDYLSNSAEQGNQFAQYTLGVVYLKGEICRPDIEKAISCFEQSANQNNQFAQYQLGKLYYFGADGIEPDMEKAIDYLTKSAEQGNEYAVALLNWKPGIYTGFSHGEPAFSETMVSLSSDMRQLFEHLANEHDHMLNQMIYQKLEREKAKENSQLQQ